MLNCDICSSPATDESGFGNFCNRCGRIALKVPPIFRKHLDHITDEIKGSFYFYGPSGILKSQTAANMLFTRGSGKWVNVPRLLHEIRQSYNKSEADNDLVGLYSRATWLCLDDLGVDKTTDWVVQTLYLIVNNRYENMLETVITSNLSLEELAERMGDDRLASRIAGMCKVVKMEGEDRRTKK